jgi:predicted nucleic acid-binding protein
MPDLVLDASVVIDWFETDEQVRLKAKKLHDGIVGGEMGVIIPKYLLLEVANVLVTKKHFGKEAVCAAIQIILDLGMRVEELGDEDWAGVIEVACDYKLAVYDAVYVYMAKKFGTKLLSKDRRLLEVGEWVVEEMEDFKKRSR